MIPGRKTPEGVLYVKTGLPLPSNAFWQGGIATSKDGQVHILDGVGTRNNGGLITDHDGRLCIIYGAAIDRFEGGLPKTVDGYLVCQMNQTPAPTDPFVGGLRVGPLGGVYVTDAAIPTGEPFSSGFDEGFGG